MKRFLRRLKMGDQENISFRYVIVKCKNIKAKESYRSLRMDYIQRSKNGIDIRVLSSITKYKKTKVFSEF